MRKISLKHLCNKEIVYRIKNSCNSTAKRFLSISWVFVNNAAINTGMHISFQISVLFSLGKYSEIKLLTHTAVLFFLISIVQFKWMDYMVSELYLDKVAFFFLRENSKCWQECREIKTFIHSQCEYKILQLLWKTAWQFFKKLKYIQ